MKSKKRIPGFAKDIKFPVKRQSNSESTELKKAMESAAVIFDDWRTEFINTPAKPSELPGRINDLHAKIEAGIRSEKYRKAVLPFLDKKLADLSLGVQMAEHSFQVEIKCANRLANKKKCGNRFIGIGRRNQLEDGTLSFTCPKCDGKIGKEQIKLKT